MTNQQPEPRVFVKKVNGETKTRNVTSAAAEVSAIFDGYMEKPAGKPAKAAPSTGTGG